MLVPLEPLMDVALEPVVDVPVEPITGALGATGALLGAVLPPELLRGFANGATAGVAVGPGGRMPARHCLMNLLLCLPV